MKFKNVIFLMLTVLSICTNSIVHIHQRYISGSTPPPFKSRVIHPENITIIYKIFKLKINKNFNLFSTIHSHNTGNFILNYIQLFQ